MSLFFASRSARTATRSALGGGYELPARSNRSRSKNLRPVGMSDALSLPAVWACVRLIADALAMMPADVYRKGPGRTQTEIDAPPIIENPSGRDTRSEWMFSLLVSWLLRGNGFGEIVDRDALGFAKQVELYHPDHVHTWYDRQGIKRYKLLGRDVTDPSNIWHTRAFVIPGRATGLSAISHFAETIGLGLEAEKFGVDFFVDGGHPTAILASDSDIPSPAEARIVKDRFMQALRGSREPVVLGKDLKYQAIQVAPNESQFLETQKWSVQQVCRVFGVPPEMVGGEAGGSLTYSNAEQRNLDLLTYCLGPWKSRAETTLSALLPPGHVVKLNAGALLQADLLTRYRAHEIGIRAKFLHPDEARALENRPPLTPDQLETMPANAGGPAPIPVIQE